LPLQQYLQQFLTGGGRDVAVGRAGSAVGVLFFIGVHVAVGCVGIAVVVGTEGAEPKLAATTTRSKMSTFPSAFVSSGVPSGTRIPYRTDTATRSNKLTSPSRLTSPGDKGTRGAAPAAGHSQALARTVSTMHKTVRIRRFVCTRPPSVSPTKEPVHRLAPPNHRRDASQRTGCYVRMRLRRCPLHRGRTLDLVRSRRVSSLLVLCSFPLVSVKLPYRQR